LPLLFDECSLTDYGFAQDCFLTIEQKQVTANLSG